METVQKGKASKKAADAEERVVTEETEVIPESPATLSTTDDNIVVDEKPAENPTQTIVENAPIPLGVTPTAAEVEKFTGEYKVWLRQLRNSL